ncbi:MAG: sulfotransferase [Gammaproteobacteria bacterium]|nr:sulfotransferase [Gammaproteobacteria bacterium]
MADRMADREQLRALLKEGFAALQSGRTQHAGQLCKRILDLAPKLVQGHFLLGLVALEAGDRRTALQAFGSVTALDPKHNASWAQLAKLFVGEGQVNRADAALARAVRGDPEEPLVQDLIGTVLSLLGEYALAQEWFAKACAKRPRHVGMLLNLANNHVYFGDTGQALALYERILEIEPNSPQAHWSLAGARKAPDDAHVLACRTLLAERPGLHPRLQAFYHYAIGKECEDLERWEEAFAAFAEGAAARRETVEYDEAAEIEMFAFLEASFDEGWLAAREPGNPSRAPIFVLGQPRTGTTLIERIISSHSAVTSAGELQQFSLAIRRLSDHRDPKRFSAALFEAALGIPPAALGATYLETTRRMQGGTPHFVDKLPQNYLCIPLILAALPNAKIVHLVRDPMDASFASFKQLFADAYLHSYDQREMARHHARYRKLMATWRRRFGNRFHDMSYEATTSDLEAQVRGLLDFLELPFEEACVNFHAQEGAVSTASAAQVREPAHSRSVGRWRRYRTQLEPMRQELAKAGVAAARVP